MPFTSDDIERDPSLATEGRLEILLKSLIEVHESEGRDLGGYDYNLQSYYESRTMVTSVVRLDYYNLSRDWRAR